MYKAVLISHDGEDYVTDFARDTVEEVIDELNDMGSRWIFYPFHCVVRIHNDGSYVFRDELLRKRPVSVAPPFEEFKGKSFRTLLNHVKSLTEGEVYAILNS